MYRLSIIGGYDNSNQVADLAQGLDVGGDLKHYADQKWLAVNGSSCTDWYGNLGDQTEVLEVGHGKFVKVTTKEQIIVVHGKKYQAAVVVVDPVEGEITENNIYVGGFSVNTPEYYRNLMPFAVMGKRQILINLLGAGGDGFAEANKTLYGKDSIASVGMHLDILKQQLDQIMAEEVKEGVPINITGMSYGGFLVLHTLTGMRNEHKERISNVFLDDPVMPGNFPFGVVSAGHTGYLAMRKGATPVVCGKGGILTEQFVEKMFGVPNEHVERVTRSCFPAHGGFMSMAFSCLGYPDINHPITLYQRPENAKIIPTDQTDSAIAHYYYANPDNRIRHIIQREPYNSRHVLMPTLAGPEDVLKAYPSVKSVGR